MRKQDLERREGVFPKLGNVLAEVLAESLISITLHANVVF